MATQVQNRRGSTAEHSTFTGANGELTVDTTKRTLVVHDGATAGGRPLLREDQSNLPTSAPTTGIYNASGSLAISTSSSERIRIGASGQIGLGGANYGTSGQVLTSAGSGAAPTWQTPAAGNTDKIEEGNSSAEVIDTGSDGRFVVTTEGSERLRVDSSGRVGIGNTTPSYLLDLLGSAPRIRVKDSSTGAAFHHFENNSGNFYLGIDSSTGGSLSAGNYARVLWSQGAYPLVFATNDTQRAQIDSSGRLLVGTSTTASNAAFQVQGISGNSSVFGVIRAQRGSTPANGEELGYYTFGDKDSANSAATIIAARDGGTWTSGTSMPTLLTFSTCANGASTPTERMRIHENGGLSIGTVSKGGSVSDAVGVQLGTSGVAGFGQFIRDGGLLLQLNRRTNDGDLVVFHQDNTQEGSISVSGTTVSYNGAHLSRWSQLPSGAERIEILRGTVLSNIDEMCEWTDEDNEQLNRMKVSDIEGDKNVAGVFQAWDDDDDTYINDFYCAMTGDFIIRIAQGVTVERGDLLMSAGDGTAKPQDDDIIRSKTIAKVTSTNVSCTYEDGSYCVPCVLMAC